jgi:metal-responsive CopG/Arc/MetJ family transcriptional regulator
MQKLMVAVFLSIEDIERFTQIARAKGKSRSEIIREILTEYLKKQKPVES